jgi:hypothetical protein
VRIDGVRGEPPPPTAKVALNYVGGYRNTMTLVLTGLQPERKADLALRTLWSLVPGGRESFDEIDVALTGPGLRSDDPATNDDALSFLRVTVMSADESTVGRSFSNAVIEMALASYPGFFGTSAPTGASQYGVYWPTTVPADLVKQVAVVEGRAIPIAAVVASRPVPVAVAGGEDQAAATPATPATHLAGATTPAPLGRIAGARSGDKGGNANVGLWVRSAEAFSWLDAELTTDRFRSLVPESDGLEVERHRLPNLLALNFVVKGLLGKGVAASTRTDAQAKGLGEYLRAKIVQIPAGLLVAGNGA